ncbi:uncharacterized protein IL334_007332 [Kwoniella shivajii]|uniref:Uncharacterized protein n=1 Tax=Kwoniella shivajii TaxID=564305 RepID=A0ABZ1DA84_9TREE|nr:hypothetical protein IL334_007332 [Kwoniella shivajii]
MEGMGAHNLEVDKPGKARIVKISENSFQSTLGPSKEGIAKFIRGLNNKFGSEFECTSGFMIEPTSDKRFIAFQPKPSIKEGEYRFAERNDDVSWPSLLVSGLPQTSEHRTQCRHLDVTNEDVAIMSTQFIKCQEEGRFPKAALDLNLSGYGIGHKDVSVDGQCIMLRPCVTQPSSSSLNNRGMQDTAGNISGNDAGTDCMFVFKHNFGDNWPCHGVPSDSGSSRTFVGDVNYITWNKKDSQWLFPPEIAVNDTVLSEDFSSQIENQDESSISR